MDGADDEFCYGLGYVFAGVEPIHTERRKRQDRQSDGKERLSFLRPSLPDKDANREPSEQEAHDRVGQVFEQSHRTPR